MDTLVSVEWLAERLGDPDLVILDATYNVVVDPDQSYRLMSARIDWEREHIPGSAFVDIQADLSDPNSPFQFTRPSAEVFAAAIGRFGVADGRRVVTYDGSGNSWAARVWWMLRAFGFDQAAVLDGGWKAWKAAGLPTSTEPPKLRPATFTPRPRPELFVDTAEVEAATGAAETCIVNVLDAKQHSGETNPYGRPGHIPTAVNVSVGSVVDPKTQRFRPLEELRSLVSGDVPSDAERVITYCGGGIAACGQALVLTRLGYERVSVYDGSMSEWVSDPSRPLEL